MKVLDYDGLDHSLAKLKAYLDSIRARDLADADAQTLVLSQGIAVNSARLQSIEDWLREDERNYVDCITLGGVTYLPQNGGIALPDYPTTLPASDVYAWAKAATKPSYTFSEIGSKPTTLAGYGITDAYISNGTIVIGSNSITPLTSHQSLSGYAHQVVVNGDAFEAVNSTIELPDYPTTLPASDVYAWAKAATKPTYTATEVGLGNVTNDAQVKRTEMGAASGVATLGTDGKIPASQLPSYVDDVLEYASLSAFPATGESGKIYVALDTNKTYRWSGTTYTEISPSIVIGTTTGTAFDGSSGYAHVTDGDIHVTAALKTAWSAKYDLPSGGIPSTDLASAIQTSLGHGDTAYGWGDHALAGYFPATSFTKSNIKTTLGISDWALASTKPSYTFSEIGSKPTTLLGYGITDAVFGAHTAGSDVIPITLGSTTQNVLIAHQSLAGYVNSINTASEAVVGKQFLSGVSKVAESGVIDFQFSRILLDDVDGTDDLKSIEALTGTSGLLRKTGSNTWSLDTTQYITKDVNNLTNYYTKTEVDARVFFEEYTLPNNGGTAIKLKDAYVGMFASGFVSSGGISTSGGGGGTAVNALRDWANYRPEDTTQVLGSNLGKGLKDDITTLQGYFTNGVANYADDANTLGGHASTYFAHTVRLGSTDYSASNGLINIPSITTGVIGDLETWIASKGFVTKTVNDLTNYYTKPEVDEQALALSQGIASNSARIQSIEDSLRDDEWNDDFDWAFISASQTYDTTDIIIP